jgi:hypothetical protein
MTPRVLTKPIARSGPVNEGLPGEQEMRACFRALLAALATLVTTIYPIASGTAYAQVKVVDTPKITVWEIREPVVTKPLSKYEKITFQAGDHIAIDAGGCVQTGGAGRTWKRYIDPRGPNADRIYHGLIQLPGQPHPVRIMDLLNELKSGSGSYVVPQAGEMTLYLGYEDDNYDDNGYWGHDDGTENQCKGIGAAWVSLTVVHR